MCPYVVNLNDIEVVRDTIQGLALCWSFLVLLKRRTCALPEKNVYSVLYVLLEVTAWNFVADVGGWPLSIKSECSLVWEAEPRKPALSNCCCIISWQAPTPTPTPGKPAFQPSTRCTLLIRIFMKVNRYYITGRRFSPRTLTLSCFLSTLVHDVRKGITTRNFYLLLPLSKMIIVTYGISVYMLCVVSDAKG
jgi:hypothetical protein